MYIFLAALGLALLLALVALACACRMLRNDMRRGKDCMDLSVPEAAANTRWAPYAAEVSESIKRLRALPWEEVRISAAEGFPLRARLLRGTSGDTAILVHGYRSCGELDFALTAEHYLELGFGLLMVDQRGHGGSGGKMVTMGLRESGDVRRWAEAFGCTGSPLAAPPSFTLPGAGSRALFVALSPTARSAALKRPYAGS